jgi:type I restriction enzyme, S subunit
LDDAVRVCLLPALDTHAIAKADCFCIRPDRDLIDPRFLVFQLGMANTREALVEQIHGATRPRITTGQLRNLDIVLSPLSEQRRIVAKIESLLAEVNAAGDRLVKLMHLANTVECHLASASKAMSRITQSILAKAFRGELVPTEAELARQEGRDYEPATVLLERIARERAVAGTATRAGRTKAPGRGSGRAGRSSGLASTVRAPER